ncbi:tetratricopeptide repeat protein [Thermus sp. FJN-A]
MRLILKLLLLLGLGLAPSTWAQGAEEYYARCARLYEQGALASAQATCELALVSDPEHQPSLRLLARILLERGELGQAEAYLERLGEDPEGLLLRARLLLRQGKPAQVLTLPLPPGPEARLLEALALEELGRLEEALALAQSLPSSPEGRLLLARLLLAQGRPGEALAALGATLEEEVERGRLLLLLGRPQEAIPLLERVLPRLTGHPDLRGKALSTLALAYLGQGDLSRGLDALRQLSQQENLPARFLAQTWMWFLALLFFLTLVLLGESRIEPLRTLEVVENPLPGPGSLYGMVGAALLVAVLFALFLGKALYANALALFTPYQRDVVLPAFYLVYGLGLFLGLALWQRKRWATLVGPWASWVEGFWVGPALVLALFLYGLARDFLGLPTLPLNLLTFLGLALMEPFFRGLVPWVLRERYRDLSPHLSVLLFALAVPGPTLLLVLLGAGLLWAKERAGSVLGVALGWVVAGVVLALFPASWLRRF